MYPKLRAAHHKEKSYGQFFGIISNPFFDYHNVCNRFLYIGIHCICYFCVLIKFFGKMGVSLNLAKIVEIWGIKTANKRKPPVSGAVERQVRSTDVFDHSLCKKGQMVLDASPAFHCPKKTSRYSILGISMGLPLLDAVCRFQSLHKLCR